MIDPVSVGSFVISIVATWGVGGFVLENEAD
jgi:hypothetical protein